MTREPSIGKRVALLATGDELTSGDILNTNGRDIAAHLSAAAIQPGLQMVVPDQIQEIEQAIRHLLSNHDALVITGGLGPTSDDLTRFALAKAVDRPLIFNDPVWDNIVEKLRQFGYKAPPESNRQQALFPQDADIIHNRAGTAAGCIFHNHGKPIFMLPGPPAECLPMVDDTLIPHLTSLGFCQTILRKRWLLFGVSEGQIAEKLDAIAFDGQCKTGYRLCYPYVEFKLYAANPTHFTETVKAIEQFISPHLIKDGNQTASEAFSEKLIRFGKKLVICDEATGGFLESALKTPETHALLQFSATHPGADVLIQGLDEFWLGKNTTRTTLQIHFPNTPDQPTLKTDAPLRGARIKHYAVEWVCRALYEWL